MEIVRIIAFYWVGNPGNQSLWTPKWHSIFSEKSFRVRKVGKKCITVRNVEEEEEEVNIERLSLWLLENK